MSNVGKQPISIPAGVDLIQNKTEITVKGKLGELKQVFHAKSIISITDDEVIITRSSDERQQRELHGLTRVLIANMIEGVTTGFQKELNLVGVGYSADASKGDFLILNIGFSHPIYFETPNGISFETPNANTIIVKGINKQEVGQVSANIRELRKPEPYKGKGIKYSDEHIRRKAGKSIGLSDQV
jgi:large subunit ribosomal protein L6